MKSLGENDRIALLMHGYLHDSMGKLGHGMLRYGRAEIVAIVDRENTGSQFAVRGTRYQVVADVHEARRLGAEILIVGVAPPGGLLPTGWKGELIEGLHFGMSLVNPLHGKWNDDRDFAAAMQPGRWIWDMRAEPAGLQPGVGAALEVPAIRLLSVGTDMAVGKMTASLELVLAARKRGRHAEFIATGQVGMCIWGGGVAIDGVRVDYAAGAIEREILAAAESIPHPPDDRHLPLIVIEGQGALNHPAATANLALLRGAMPTHLLMVHRAKQDVLRRMPSYPVPPLLDLIRLYEDLAACNGVFPRPKTIGVALNCAELSEAEARAEIDRVAAETGLPVADPVMFGCEALLDALGDCRLQR